MDYMFSQHDLSFLDDVIPEKDKKKKEDEKKKKKKGGSIDSDAEDVRLFTVSTPTGNILFFLAETSKCLIVHQFLIHCFK